MNTSMEALQSINVTSLEELVLEAIKESGASGCIADDIRNKFPDVAYSSITARPASLLRKGLITRGPDIRPGNSGRRQLVMRAA